MATEVDISSVLFTTWVAKPWNYNACYQINFKGDGSGHLVLGYGQSIYAMVEHRFEVLLPNLVRLMYLGFSSAIPERPYDKRLLERPFAKVFEAEFNKWTELRFELFESDFCSNQEMRGPPFNYHFRWLLALDRQPYPEGVESPHGPLREFYGPF